MNKKNYICKQIILEQSNMIQSRIEYYDILNILSCMAVVILHSNGYIHSFVKDDYWGLHVAIDTLFFFAVPLFFMLSGANLINYRKKYSTNTFIRKRLKRTVFPFLFWSIFFLISFTIIHWGDTSQMITWKKTVQILITGKIPLTNYWFFIPLFFLYMFMPFISLMIKDMNTKQISYLCLLLIVFQTIIPTILNLIEVNEELPLPLNGFLIYALLGYLFSISDFEKNDKLILTLCFAAFASLFIRFWLAYQSATKDEGLFDYLGLYALLPSCSIFLIAKRSFTPERKLTNVCHPLTTFLAPKSFGVFLLHTFIIRLLDNIPGIEMSNPWFIPLAFFISYLTSIIIVHFLQKNSLTKYLVP